MTSAELIQVAFDLGVTDMEVGPAGHGYEVAAYAPKGSVWVETDCHALIEYWYSNPAGCRKEAARRMQLGFKPCEDPDCEYCHPTKEF